MKQTLVLNSTRFLSSKSFSKLKKQSLISTIQIKQLKRRSRRTRSFPFVFAAQSNFLRVLQTVWKLGNDGIEAGTKLVPDSVPRPIARISDCSCRDPRTIRTQVIHVSGFLCAGMLSLSFYLQGLRRHETILACLAGYSAMLGLVYFTFIALNKDDGPRGDGGTTSTEDTLEEARRIMEKYK